MNPAIIPRAEPDADLVTMLLPEGSDWRLATEGRRCRAGASRYRRGCGAQAVFELNRGGRQWPSGRRTPDSWWGYCAEHAYSRVLLEDGLYYAIAVAPDAAAAQEWP